MTFSKGFVLLATVLGLAAAACGKAAPSGGGGASSLTGAGSTFAAPLYQQWGTTYQSEHGVAVNYEAVGSGAGITDITQKTVDFGASDAAYTPTAPSGPPILNIPTAISAVVVTYNLPDFTGSIDFSGKTLADIFSATVTRWNDPEIVADNPRVSLPNKPITVVHRSDGSGTTNIFTSYLSFVSPAWKNTLGSGTTVAWPSGTLGGKGSSGVEADISQTPYSIGYVELTYAVQNKTPSAGVRNGDGSGFVTPSLRTAQAATAGVQASAIPAGNNVIFTMLNEPGPDAYPICGPTYILAYQQQPDASKGRALTRFITWGLTTGQGIEASLDYVKLPVPIQQRSLEAVDSITYNGTPLQQHSPPQSPTPAGSY